MTPKLFVTRVLPVDPRDIVGAGIDVVVFGEPRAPTRDELVREAHGASALVTLVADPVDRALLDALASVRVVANCAVGVDNVDLDAARERGVWVTNTPDVLTDATADLTWALILGVTRRLHEGERIARSAEPWVWAPTMLLGRDLAGKTLGVLGFGRIGQAVARRARAFGMEVVYASRSPAPGPVELALAARRTKDELIEQADVLSIHCPLTSETFHAIADAELSRMKKSAILVNTARGPIVDEAALVRALEAGLIAGAGLDVYEHEPRIHPGLQARDDVVLLPHIGSATVETRMRMATMALTDAARVLRGERPHHVVCEGRAAAV